MKEVLRGKINQPIIYALALLFLAFIFLAITTIKKNAIQEIEDNVQLCISLAKYAEIKEKQNFVEQCKLYLGTPCLKNGECGPFPCVKNECYIKPCNSDNDCQKSLCGQYLAPIHNFCTVIDVK